MKALVEFIKKTKQLQSHLEKGFPNDNREEYIETIDSLLVERQQILNELPDLSSILDERNKQEMINLEKQIQELMKNYQGIIKDDLKTLQLQKRKGNQYSEPYGNFSVDGMFYDKKK